MNSKQFCMSELLNPADGCSLVVEMEPMPGEYYRSMGWEANGIPTPVRLKKPGMPNIWRVEK